MINIFNTTCDIYRSGAAPPSTPDVSGVLINLCEEFFEGHRININTADVRYTHIAYVPGTTDIRDGYTAETSALSGFDLVWVPDKNGTKFEVVFVARTGIGCTSSVKKVFLRRRGPTWPTNYL